MIHCRKRHFLDKQKIFFSVDLRSKICVCKCRKSQSDVIVKIRIKKHLSSVGLNLGEIVIETDLKTSTNKRRYSCNVGSSTLLKYRLKALQCF